jgi:hypothetical protein
MSVRGGSFLQPRQAWPRVTEKGRRCELSCGPRRGHVGRPTAALTTVDHHRRTSPGAIRGHRVWLLVLDREMLPAQQLVSRFPPRTPAPGSIPLIRNRRYQEKGTQLSNPRYPYPIFELLPTPGRIGLFSLSAAIMALNTMAIKWLYGRVNGFGTSDAPTSKPGDIKKDELHET